MREAKKKFSPLRQFSPRVAMKVILGLMVAVLLTGQAQSLGAQDPTITKVSPAVVQPDDIFKISFSEEVTITSVKIGNLDASLVSSPSATKTVEVKVPSNVSSGPQTISVVRVGSPQPITASITIASPTSITEVTPAVTQPGAVIFLTFNRQVKPTSVKIGTLDCSFASQSPQRLQVTLPSSHLPLGEQAVSITTSSGELVTSSIAVAPLILGLRVDDTNKVELSRVVLAESEMVVQFADKIPSGIKQILKARLIDTGEKTERNACAQGIELSSPVPQDDRLVVTAPNQYSLAKKTYALRVCAGEAPLENEPRIRVQHVGYMYVRASIVVILLFLLIYLLYLIGRWVKEKLQQGQPPQRYVFLKMLLLEPENQTYSLSRAQFLGWLIVIAWSYLFLYYAHGYIQDSWGFPKFGSSLYAFLISLGTLIAAQATNRMTGVKGAGEEQPSVADLVVHGGVLALDRVQQVFWTLIALGMFVRITIAALFKESLPDIPNELLALMGLSSVGYLGGKLVRGPGPVIEQVSATAAAAGNAVLSIKGKHLSKDAFVWIDGEQLKENVTSKADDPDDPLKFAEVLEVTLPSSIVDWNAKNHAITVVNSDAQRADFRIQSIATEKPTEITEVTPGQPDANGNVTLTIEGTGIAPGATIMIAADPSFQPVQDNADPNIFTVQVASDWTNNAHQLLLQSNGKISSFTFPPSN